MTIATGADVAAQLGGENDDRQGDQKVEKFLSHKPQ
jgi:hypothetical protein